MLYSIVYLLLLVSPSIISSLQCNFCPSPIYLNYSVTVDTIPSLENCVIVDSETQCYVNIYWFRDPPISMLIYAYEMDNIPKNNETLVMSVQAQVDGDGFSKRSSHEIAYVCKTSDKCNNIDTVKRLLNSTTLTEQFVKEFTPLLANVTSFTNDSAAACYSFSNSTNSSQCNPSDIDHCQRCHISTDYSTSTGNEICATCPKSDLRNNKILRQMTFILDNRSQPIEHIELWCQQAGGCNSIANIIKIRQASQIKFDYDRYFDPLSPVMS